MKGFIAFLLLFGAPVAALESQDSIAQQVLNLSNQARRLAGLSPLSLDPRLCQAAQQHAQEMDSLRYFGHTSPLQEFATLAKRINLFGYYGLSSGENLHREQGYAATGAAQRAVRDWLESPQHRKNLLNPKFNRMGVGISRVGDQCTLTQDLAYSAIDVLEQQLEGNHLRLKCQVNDGPRKGALIYQGCRCADWVADAQGKFQVEVELPGPGTVALGQAIGERDWVIETEWMVRSAR